MSNNSSDHWMQLYQTNFDGITTNQIESLHPTTTTTSGVAATSRSNNLGPNNQGGSRVARPVRRRSRASRRTPTTLVNTDATNFRAMVQQFTGVPTTTTTVAAASGPQLLHAASTAVSASQASMFQLQYYGTDQMRHDHVFMAANNARDGSNGNISSHAPPGSS